MAKLLYRNVSTARRWVRRVGAVVDPGEMFESDHEINDANFEEVKEKKRPGTAPAEEDRP